MSEVARRSSMTLFSGNVCHYSHRIRIVLAEKSIGIDLVEVDRDMPSEIADLNPYHTVPTFADRELVLYESKIIMEYLDERFPHPPLLPVYPVARAESRQLIYRIERDWCPLVDTILIATKSDEKARRDLRDELLTIAPIFAEKSFFMSDEFSLIDCCMAPILWRLGVLGIELPATKQSKPLLTYMERLFARPSFKASLSARERDMLNSRAA
ncbi:MAG TPA: glutathione S-transferase N-terminal domain-containing protein [Spongiibacteraceae bacterium]|jgi:RNA polymerase-associated protein